MTATMYTPHKTRLNAPHRPRLTSDMLSILTLSVLCPIAKKHRTLVKRYAQFVFLRQQWTELYDFAKNNSHLTPLKDALGPFMAMSFPKKPLSTDEDDEIAAREAAFNDMVLLLLDTRSKVIKAAQVYHADSRLWEELDHVRSMLDDFLDMPSLNMVAKTVEYTSLKKMLPFRRVENPFQRWLMDCARLLGVQLV
ncbi:hypothetical protein AeRB84_001780 [Aphanomyces euteiches]|nr:hypothetical protein AeRB84_001780 [Aphanomyces euteiches]